MIKLTRNSTWLIYFTWHFNCHFSCAMCNQFTFYLVSATRYHSRTFHSNMSQMHSGPILAASHFPHLSLVACNWRWRCGGWLCVTMPCPRSRSPLAPCPATDWAPWSPNQSAVPTLRLRPEHGELPAHRPAPRRRTGHRQLRTRARGNLPSVGRTTLASSRQRGDSLCCRFYKSRYLVDWIFYWIC